MEKDSFTFYFFKKPNIPWKKTSNPINDGNTVLFLIDIIMIIIPIIRNPIYAVFEVNYKFSWDYAKINNIKY